MGLVGQVMWWTKTRCSMENANLYTPPHARHCLMRQKSENRNSQHYARAQIASLGDTILGHEITQLREKSWSGITRYLFTGSTSCSSALCTAGSHTYGRGEHLLRDRDGNGGLRGVDVQRLGLLLEADAAAEHAGVAEQRAQIGKAVIEGRDGQADAQVV